jgi:hypothetical protein
MKTPEGALPHTIILPQAFASTRIAAIMPPRPQRPEKSGTRLSQDRGNA